MASLTAIHYPYGSLTLAIAIMLSDCCDLVSVGEPTVGKIWVRHGPLIRLQEDADDVGLLIWAPGSEPSRDGRKEEKHHQLSIRSQFVDYDPG